MKIDLTKIKHKPEAALEFSLNGQIDAKAAGYEEFSLPDLVEVKGRALNQSEGRFFLSGQYHGPVELVCGRCGSPFVLEIAGEFEAMFVAEATEEWDGEQSLFLLTGDYADLSALLAGEIFFSLPMQPLCREDCRGLCPICGNNQNDSQCSCRADDIDPRWEKLKDFRID